MSDHELPLYNIVTPPPPHYASGSPQRTDPPTESVDDNYHRDLKLALNEIPASDSSPDHATDAEVNLPPTLFGMAYPAAVEGFQRPSWDFIACWVLVTLLVCLVVMVPIMVMYYSAPR